MSAPSHIPLADYLDTALLSFVTLPSDSLQRIGVVGTKVTVDEQVIDGNESSETFYDEFEGKNVTVTWTETEIKHKIAVQLTLSASDEMSFKLPGLDGIAFVIASAGSKPDPALTVTLTLDEDGVSLDAAMACSLRFDSSVVRPMRRTGQPGAGAFKPDTSGSKVELQIAKLRAGVDTEGKATIDIDGSIAFDQPIMIGDTGVVLDDVKGLTFNFDGSAKKPISAPAGWKGLHIGEAKVCIPSLLSASIVAKGLGIGSGGVYGTIGYAGSPLSGEVLGMKGSVSSVAIEFVQSVPVKASIGAKLTLPFFEESVPVKVGLGYDGSFSVQIGNGTGQYKLVKKGVLSVDIDSLGFSVKDGAFVALLSGQLKPLIAELDWPSFEVRELAIDSMGNVRLDCGWLNLRKAYTLDFHGFQFEITKLGMGKADGGGKWVGFSGAVKLVDGLKAGGSVEGLRITWYDDGGSPGVSFEGIGVEMEIPNTLRFEGEVSYREIKESGRTVHRFDGEIELSLLALGLEIDATLVFGNASGPNGSYSFMGIYLGLELPAGIPLWATGLGLYGMAGLFALSMEPDKKPDEAWYGTGPSDGWYKRPEIGVTDLGDKWRDSRGSLALGAGVTIGTLGDNGYGFNGRLLLLIVFPGPVLMIEGRANVLKRRTSLGEEPAFRALAVLDFRAGTFLVGLDARYRFDSKGRLLDISGSAEVFFDFDDPSNWHVYLGEREPRDKRIRARILTLFEANTYWMLDAKSLAFGSWYGYDKTWKFGPVRLTLEAWMEKNVKVSWSPPHLHGDIWLHGKGAIKVLWFGFGLSLDAGIAADVFDPFHLLGKLGVGIDLTWPLPDCSITITLEWGGGKDWPAMPLPLKEVAVEHLKVSTSWPLPRDKGLLAPDYDAGEGIRVDTDPSFNDKAPPPSSAPVVPVDSKPHLTFSRPIHDEALVGTVVSNVKPPRERIGDPGEDPEKAPYGTGPVLAKYTLEEVALERWVEATSKWMLVARKAASSLGPNADDIDDLYGSWAPVPPMPNGGGSSPAQVKLWLWSKNAFDYTRRGGRTWNDRFTERFDDYPCDKPPKRITQCWDFRKPGIGGTVTGIPIPGLGVGWVHPSEPDLWLAWLGPDALKVEPFVPGDPDPVAAVCFPPRWDRSGPFGHRNFLLIRLPARLNRGALIHCRATKGVTGFAVDDAGTWHTLASDGTPAQPYVEVQADDIHWVVLQFESRMCVRAICQHLGAGKDELVQAEKAAKHTIDSLERWKHTDAVFEPNTSYRLRIRTSINAKGESPLSGTRKINPQIEYAFFRTEGPPGRANLSLPIGLSQPEEHKLRDKTGKLVRVDGTPAKSGSPSLKSQLNNLKLYVRQTLPATVPSKGQDPFLPRPVYRGYDVGVAFNENYVRLMYRLAGSDLAMYLFDANTVPVRDASGRLVILRSLWDVASKVELDESKKTWTTTVNASSCGKLDEKSIPLNQRLGVEGTVLAPDAVHEARLVPLALHEDFSDEKLYRLGDVAKGPSGTLGRWYVRDEGSVSAPSRWEIGEVGKPPVRVVCQSSNIHGGATDAAAPAKPGTLLLLADRDDLSLSHADQPGQWTDYRFSVLVRSTDNDAIGVVFRYLSKQRYYRFSKDRERRYRRLVRVVDGFVTVLAEDDWVYRKDQDYEIAVEATGSKLVVYQDGEQVFSVEDSSMDRGRVGLYCWASEGAQFTDVRVDDLRITAKPVYRFSFTTSRYANFAHQIHSFEDETWRLDVPAALLPLLDAAALASQATSQKEQRDWRALEAAKPLDGTMRAQPTVTEVTRLQREGQTVAFLLRSPEPVDWSRCSAKLSHADGMVPVPSKPRVAKLCSIQRHRDNPNLESVALILRDKLDLSGHLIEHKGLPGILEPPKANPWLLVDSFTGRESGLLLRETFGSAALDRYEIVDEGSYWAPSKWAVRGGRIVQSSNIYGGPFNKAALAKPGTTAVTGSPSWADVRVEVSMLSNDNDSMGVVFRYVDGKNFYRFEMNAELGYRRLLKRSSGKFTELWSDDAAYTIGQRYDVVILAYGRHLYGVVDDALLFHVEDSDLVTGRVGLYCWANTDCRFEKLTVQSLEADPLLRELTAKDLANARVEDAVDAISGPSVWKAVGESIVETSGIHVPLAVSLDAHGTHLVAGDEDWRDVRIYVRAESSHGGGIGIMFRYRDEDNYYRFSMDSKRGSRQLVKLVDGKLTVLWQDTEKSYSLGEAHDLMVEAVGERLRVRLESVALMTVFDDAHSEGALALYAHANSDARFSNLTVLDPTRHIGRWQVYDEGHQEGPSRWKRSHGNLAQSSNIFDGSLAAAKPEKPGTLAVGGSSAWRDIRLTVRMRSDDDDAIGVVFRFTDERNYYRYSTDKQRNYRRLVKNTDGVVTMLWEDSLGYVVGDSFTVTIDAIGSRLRVYHDEEVMCEVTDGDHVSGRVGMYAWGNDGARFEALSVRTPPPEAYALFRDRFAAGDVTLWSYVDVGAVSVPSQWVVTDGKLRQTSNLHSLPLASSDPDKEGTYAVAGSSSWGDVVVQARLESHDDDAIGIMFRFVDDDNYYRFSMDRERGYRRLVRKDNGMFTVLWEDDFIFDLARSYQITVIADGEELRGFFDGVPMFLVVDDRHDKGRIALYAWGNEDARYSEVRVYPVSRVFDDFDLYETFPVLREYLWSFEDEGQVNGPSEWMVKDSKLCQTSSIGDTDQVAARGTIASTSANDWRDYRMTVRLRSTATGAIGVVFRRASRRRFYRFSMDRNASSRFLTVWDDGGMNILWEDHTKSFDIDREYALTIDCVGTRITGYLDGVELFSVTGDGPEVGSIGLYCSANPGAEFLEVQIAKTRWLPYYRFESEQPLAAGTRVRVHSGSSSKAANAGPLEAQRFVTSAFETGEVAFTSEHVDLRIRGPQGIEHVRRFLRDEDYAILAARLLRKADGTAFAVVPAKGKTLAPGQYRLALEWLRDPGPDDRRLTERGQQGPERVHIDFSN